MIFRRRQKDAPHERLANEVSGQYIKSVCSCGWKSGSKRGSDAEENVYKAWFNHAFRRSSK